MNEITQIVNDLLQKDPAISLRESLKTMFVAASRNFHKMPEDDAGMIIDHYQALDNALEKIEIWQEKQG